jgi:putative nucleotidyltransferase with HDIG domain
MIKKIKVEQLRPGIFVHDFNCDWAGDNIFINQALINNEKAVKIISSWGIKEVYIDTERGLDVKRAKTACEVQQKTDNDLNKLARKRNKTVPPSVPLKEEIQMGRKIKKEAVDIMRRTMASVQEGKQVDVNNTFQLVKKMEASISRNPDALVMLTRIRKKDEYTLIHSISVTSLVLTFCNFCRIPYDMTINMATGALLHDIGKLQVPVGILNKPGKLTREEFAVIKKHSEYSAEILKKTKGLPVEAFDIALHHHERYDGTGYPHGQKGDGIDFASRVTSICDVYDAITSVRCYRQSLGRVAGLRKLYEWSDYHFDKELTFKFIHSIGVYPVGTYVRMENELSGVVTDSTENMLQPVVRLFYNNKNKTPMKIQEVDLSRLNINITGYDSPQKWGNDKIQTFRKNRTTLSPLQ